MSETATADSSEVPLPSAAFEQPLPPLRHGLYLLSVTLLIAVFYLYCFLALIGCVVLCPLVLVAAALTPGSILWYTVKPVLGVLGRAIATFTRGLLLRRPAEDFISLSREEAPRLWEQIETITRQLHVAMPDKVVLASGLNAWVQLSGLRKGRGKSTLAMGFDLLTGVSPEEARAVLAHEIAHARHVRRGYSGFVWRGLVRLDRCNRSLQKSAYAPGMFKEVQPLARFLAFLPGKIARIAETFGAACSRYDEFLADRIAAQVCGSQVCRKALLSIHVLDYQADRILWRDRLLQLDRQPGYTAWLREQLAVTDESRRQELASRAVERSWRHEFSTHPALADRLAALKAANFPGQRYASPDTEPTALASAIGWLRDPDATARRLLHEIEAVTAKEEGKATQARLKWMKKERGNYGLRSRQNLLWGIGCLLGGAVGFIAVGIPTERDGSWLVSGINVVAMLYGCFILLRPERRSASLPIPRYVDYRVAWLRTQDEDRVLRQQDHLWKTLPDAEKIAHEVRRTEKHAEERATLGAALRSLLPPDGRKPRAAARFWVGKGHEFLSQCDYRRAAHCARLAFENEALNPEALFIHAICQATWKSKAVQELLNLALTARGDFSGLWASAWANTLLDETGRGEALLLDLTRRRPENALLWALLAYCQSTNGKSREALSSRRRGLEVAQKTGDTNDEANHRFILAQNLTSLAQLEEAEAHFDWIEELRGRQAVPGIDDRTWEIQKFRWAIFSGEVEESLERARHIAARYAEARYFILLADMLAGSRQPLLRAAAHDYYRKAQDDGFYPQVVLALAKLAQDADAEKTARELLFQALNATRPRPLDGTHPLRILNDVLSRLQTIDATPPRKASAFEAHLDARGTPLKVKKVLLVCLFENEIETRRAATEVFAALLPGHDLAGRVSVARAAKDNQPTNSVVPGIVQSYWDE